MRVADYIAQFIEQLGVKHVFMVTGGGMMFLSDGVAANKNLSPVFTHHEQAASMAAFAYSKYTQNWGAAFFTTGCGSTNAITGLLDAWLDNIPVLYISGQVKKRETTHNSGLPLRQFGVQEADIIPVVSSLTKFTVMVNEPETIRYFLEKAVYLATLGRPGPVWLDVPLDVQGANIDESSLIGFDPKEIALDFKVEATAAEIEKITGLLKAAKRPVILAGHGIRIGRAIPEFREFIEKYQIPVVGTYLAIDYLPYDHPLFIGKSGLKGDRAGNFALQNSDLILNLGSRLNITVTGYEYKLFAREAKIVVVDIDPKEHQKNTVKIDLFVNADVKIFFSAMNESFTAGGKEWLEKCLSWKQRYPVCLPEYAQTKNGINLYYFVDRLSKFLKDDSVVVADAGSAMYAPAQGLKLQKQQRFLISGGDAEMGFTIPASVGVSMAGNKREVIAITGDGSFQFNIQELQTIVYHKLPIKLFVWNNDGYLSIRFTQRRFFAGREHGTDKTNGISFPDLEKIAYAYGIHYIKIPDNEHLDDAISRVLDYRGPVICEVICIPDQEIIPTVSSKKREDGTMVSKPLEDMYPFLDREEFKEQMVIEPLKEE
ncbi:MAG: thiamine pyrophosphate-binding protein [Patescibacteria group bacterium]